jgi:hypothetical protein
MNETRTTTDILIWLSEHPDARIHSEKSGYVLRRPGRDDLRVEDAEFDQLKLQSYIEKDEKMPGLVFRISEDGRRQVGGQVRD